MRKRKRELTHQIKVYKFRCYFWGETKTHVPDVVWNLAKKQQSYWNAMAIEFEKRSSAFPAEHPPMPHVHTSKCRESCDKPLDHVKPDRRFWDEFEAWTQAEEKSQGLNWETGPDVRDRFQSCLKRLKHGGGPPRVQRGLTSFSIPHSYSPGGGKEWFRFVGARAKRFSINPASPLAYITNQRDARRQRRLRAHFGIEDVQIPLVVYAHRSIDADTIVKKISLVGRKNALGWETYIVITVEEPKVAPSPIAQSIGIHVGWRKINDKLRVAVSFNGRMHEDLYIPLEFRARGIGMVGIQQIESIQTWRDTLLEECKARVLEALPTKPDGWRLARKSGLVRLLRDANTPEPAKAILESWLADDGRLGRKQQMMESRLIAHRGHVYKEYAAALVKQYGTIRLEEIDLHALSGKTDDPALQNAAKYRKYASVGTLLHAIRNAAKNSGAIVELINAPWTTKTCSTCGGEFEAGVKLMGQCANCKREADQDWNAATNVFSNPPPLQTAQKFTTSPEGRPEAD